VEQAKSNPSLQKHRKVIKVLQKHQKVYPTKNKKAKFLPNPRNDYYPSNVFDGLRLLRQTDGN